MKLSLVLLSVTESQHSLKKAEAKQGVLGLGTKQKPTALRL